MVVPIPGIAPRADPMPMPLKMAGRHCLNSFRLTLWFSGLSSVTVTRRSKATPTINLRDIDPFYTVLSNFLEQEGAALSIKDLSRRLNMDQRLIIKALGLFVSDGYYPLGRIRKNRFDKGGPLMKIRGKPKCYHCGKEIENPDLPCSSCSKASPKCSVCRGALVTTDNIVSCPHCEHMAHREHIIHWLNIRSSCPLCKGHLSERNLVVHN